MKAARARVFLTLPACRWSQTPIQEDPSRGTPALGSSTGWDSDVINQKSPLFSIYGDQINARLPSYGDIRHNAGGMPGGPGPAAREEEASGRSPDASGPEEPLETDPHFPERTGPACTSGLTHLTATRRLRRCAP